jgi:phage terminase small subunit
MAKKSTFRQELFAREYVIDLNGTRAAIAAGYSEATAAAQASRLLTKSKVQRLITQLNAARAAKCEMTALQADQELESLVRANMKDFGNPSSLDMDSLTREQAAAIQELSEDTTGGSGDGERKLVLRTKLKLVDKLKALDLWYRRRGLITDKADLNLSGDEKLIAALTAGRKRLSGDAGV